MTLIAQLDAYESARQSLLREMAALEPARLMTRPLPGAWSPLEILEHLALAERVVYRGLPAYAALRHQPRAPTDRIRALLVRGVLQFGIRVGIPSEEMRPGSATSLLEVRTMWDDNQRWVRGYIDLADDRRLRERVFAHPIAGPLSVYDTVPLGHAHLRTHLRQIARVCKQVG